MSVGASRGRGPVWRGAGSDTGTVTLGRQAGLSTDLKEVHRVGGTQRKGPYPAGGSAKEEAPWPVSSVS